MKLLRALVVDPDQVGRGEVAHRLRECQFDCVEAEDGIAALRFADEDSIDLIVIEIETPRLNGVQLMQIIRNGGFGKSPPPVIVCAALLNDAAWSAHQAWLDATRLPRPFTPRGFATALDAAFPAE